ncbi:hypothetical protein [Noviherbaspirillum saxi]|uniref:Uncharacterized protein n=1 Tax=Noviherbaspirillum saxi TaxID=2320863 RepID=A0A3A3FMR2_9BURK|nr:hypothetical protein [Noviherbaspirillum saxi]RJF96021.1 hypothetical protein D3871_22005 [Noviherbaspirillum saxi]
MKASELVSELSNLIAQFGDLNVAYDCDSVLTESISFEVLDAPYLSAPVFVVHLLETGNEGSLI